jgi:hypothetical protein
MAERVVEIEGLKLPLPSSPSNEVILHGDLSSFLIYSTYYASTDRSLKSVLVACAGLSLSRFGYPNDEGLPEHRLFSKGFDSLNGFGEVEDSELLKEYESMSKRSSERIWSGRGASFPYLEIPPHRHFIISFKENVFEVICHELKLVGVFSDHSSALREATIKINPD